MSGYQEEQVESAPIPVRLCAICEKPLSSYNKENICFHGHRVGTGGEREIAAAAASTDPQDSRPRLDIALAAALRIGGEEAKKEVAAILDTVADDFKMPLGDILDRYGSRRAMTARHVAVYLVWRRLGWRLPYVGEVTCQSKANAKFACKKIRNLIVKDAEMARIVSRIQAQLGWQFPPPSASRKKDGISARKK